MTTTKNKVEPKENGRPKIYTEDLAIKVCSEIAKGKSLRTVCAMSGMPSIKTIFNWIHYEKGFIQQYELAKQESADAMADEIIDIADNGTNDFMEDQYMKGKTPGWSINGENIQRSRLRVDTRKWLMSKHKPKKYGDKLDMTTNGKDLPTPILGAITKNELPVNNSDNETSET